MTISRNKLGAQMITVAANDCNKDITAFVYKMTGWPRLLFAVHESLNSYSHMDLYSVTELTTGMCVAQGYNELSARLRAHKRMAKNKRKWYKVWEMAIQKLELNNRKFPINEIID